MSSAVAAAAAAAVLQKRYKNNNSNNGSSSTSTSENSFFVGNYNRREVSAIGRYESQKLRDWNMFRQYLKNHSPTLTVSRCSGAHVMEFLRYLEDRFGKLTKVHSHDCSFFRHGQTHSHPSGSCPCPIRQAWGGLDAVIGRIRVAFEENGGLPETNPFRTPAVRLYLKEVRDSLAKG